LCLRSTGIALKTLSFRVVDGERSSHSSPDRCGHENNDQGQEQPERRSSQTTYSIFSTSRVVRCRWILVSSILIICGLILPIHRVANFGRIYRLRRRRSRDQAWLFLGGLLSELSAINLKSITTERDFTHIIFHGYIRRVSIRFSLARGVGRSEGPSI
jgi:hypothetical protein